MCRSTTKIHIAPAFNSYYIATILGCVYSKKTLCIILKMRSSIINCVAAGQVIYFIKVSLEAI